MTARPDVDALAQTVRASWPGEHHWRCDSRIERGGRECDCYMRRNAAEREALDELVRLAADAERYRERLAEIARGNSVYAPDAERRAHDAMDALAGRVRELEAALGEIRHIVRTRSTGVHMDGTVEFPTPMHAQVYEIARTALAAGDEAAPFPRGGL